MSALAADTGAGFDGDRDARGPARPRLVQDGSVQGGSVQNGAIQNGSVQNGSVQNAAGTSRLGRVPFVLALILILGIGMAGLLALNTDLQGKAFQAQDLHQRANQLTYQEAALQTQVAELRSSENLTARAFKLGMRPNPNPGFIELPSGKLIGKAKTVTGHELPMFVKTPDQISAERRAQEAKHQAEKAKKQAAAARREADKQDHQQHNTDGRG